MTRKNFLAEWIHLWLSGCTLGSHVLPFWLLRGIWSCMLDEVLRMHWGNIEATDLWKLGRCPCLSLPVLTSPWELGCSLILTLVICSPVLELLPHPAALPQTSLGCSPPWSCHPWPQLTVGPLTTTTLTRAPGSWNTLGRPQSRACWDRRLGQSKEVGRGRRGPSKMRTEVG